MPPPLIDHSQAAPGSIKPRHLAGRNTNRNTNQNIVEPRFNLLDFARQTLKNPSSIGAIAPSSKFVANGVISLAKLETANTVVELGPGTGVFTEQIVNKLDSRSTFFAIELNKAFVKATRDRCPQAEVYHDTAQSIGHYLKKYNVEKCDCIISSLPWTIFEPDEQNMLLKTLSSVLAPGGSFVSIVYLGAKARRRGRHFIDNLPTHFNTVYKTKTVWQNLPPTQIYRCGN